jgi:hypothetical protein
VGCAIFSSDDKSIHIKHMRCYRCVRLIEIQSINKNEGIVKIVVFFEYINILNI